MRQLLILGFHCKIYRRSPLVRVFADDVFLDEFELPETNYIDSSHTKFNENKLSTDQYLKYLSIQDHKLKTQFVTSTPFLKFINFHDIGKKYLKIKIEIQNNDSNYSNGFLSNSTQIMLNQLWIVSENLIERLNTLEKDYKYSVLNYKSNPNNRIYNKTLLANIEKQRRNLFVKSMTDTTFNNSKINIYDKKNKKILISDINKTLKEHWFGGDRFFEINLKKKFNLWIEEPNTLGIWRVGYPKILQYLLDKYKQYEDTRSTNT